ncbi:alpha/beta fold hydrolase [Halorarum halobium]|uniref:alpha/beta fold hydrolase n=1 Tax=Halorarum halobium TaxID=3075121 RepID=UPI0028B162C3|nr:alpha/beta hydrolase [Halobaculum sp. XH14]
MTDFRAAQDRVFEEAGIEAESRYVDLDRPGVRTHVLESGREESDDVPVFCVHGTGAFGALFSPLIANLDGAWTIAIDRPGYGLSGDFTYAPRTTRETAVTVLEEILDELEIERVNLVGSSAGGYWSLVFALARPERVRHLTLLGSAPTLPGTRPPLPLRLFSMPLLNRVVAGLGDASEADVVENLETFGEGGTIRNYPSLVQLFVAQARNPRSDHVEISELRSVVRLRGWRPSTRLREDELADVRSPTLAIWGENDLLGGPDAVRSVVGRIPNSRLETLDAGHLPWLGHPGRCAELVLAPRR